MNLYLGIDFGTTGARSTVIASEGTIQCETEYTFANNGQQQPELPSVWQNALWDTIEQIPPTIRNQARAIAPAGPSSTVILCNTDRIPVCEPILYNDARGAAVTERLRAIAPANHTVLSPTSSLAKLLWLQEGGLEAHPTKQLSRSDA